MPSTIYGLATGKLVDIGVQNRHSVQMPNLIRASLARGQAGIVGEGKNVWPNVNIDESESPVTVLTRFMPNNRICRDQLPTCTLSCMILSSQIQPQVTDARATTSPKTANTHSTRLLERFRKRCSNSGEEKRWNRLHSLQRISRRPLR